MKKKLKQQLTYYYDLPQDGETLVINGLTFGALEAIADGPNMMSQEVITEKAKNTCDYMNATIEHMTNDFTMFQDIFIDAYLKSYFEKQKRFREDITIHESDMRQVKAWGGFKTAFPILRAYIIREMGGNA